MQLNEGDINQLFKYAVDIPRQLTRIDDSVQDVCKQLDALDRIATVLEDYNRREEERHEMVKQEHEQQMEMYKKMLERGDIMLPESSIRPVPKLSRY